MEDESGGKVISLFQVTKGSCKEKFGGHKGPFQIDEWKATVVCGNCHAELNPIKLLLHFATGEKRLYQALHELCEAKSRLSKQVKEQNRTKCEHCERLTKINKLLP